MAKSGRQYGDEVRELRAAGFDFPASRGYTLANPSQWSSGQKAAVTRAFNRLDEAADTGEDFVESDVDFIPDSDSGIGEELGLEFFDDAAGDEFEEWDDVDFFDFDEQDDFGDEENDRYTED